MSKANKKEEKIDWIFKNSATLLREKDLAALEAAKAIERKNRKKLKVYSDKKILVKATKGYDISEILKEYNLE